MVDKEFKNSLKGNRKREYEYVNGKIEEKQESTRGYKAGVKVRKLAKKSTGRIKQVDKKLYTISRKEIKPRKVMKKGQMSYKLREYQPDNLLMHSNKFFKDDYQQEKRSLFFE